MVPACLLDGVLALGRQEVVAKYRREGGLYVAKMRVKDPGAKLKYWSSSPASSAKFNDDLEAKTSARLCMQRVRNVARTYY